MSRNDSVAAKERCPECWGENGEHLFNCSKFYDPLSDAAPTARPPSSEAVHAHNPLAGASAVSEFAAIKRCPMCGKWVHSLLLHYCVGRAER